MLPHGRDGVAVGPEDGEPLLIIPEAAEGCTVEAVAWHPNNVWLAAGGIDWLATSGSDGAVTIWNEDELAVSRSRRSSAGDRPGV